MDACAELDAGGDSQSRHDVDVPPRPVVEPEVHRRARLDRAHAADDLGGQAEGAREQGALEGIGLPALGGDSDLVGIGRDTRAERDEPVLLEDGLALRHRIHRSLYGDGGRRLAEPDELRVRVRQARAGGFALVDDRVDVREALCARGGGAGAPRLRYERELARW